MNLNKIKAKPIYNGGYFRDYNIKVEDAIELKYIKKWIREQDNSEQIKEKVLSGERSTMARVYVKIVNAHYEIKSITVCEASQHNLPVMSHTGKENFDEIIEVINKGGE